MEKILFTIQEWANFISESLKVKNKEYLNSARQFLYKNLEWLKSWFSPKKSTTTKDEKSPKMDEENNKFKEYFQSSVCKQGLQIIWFGDEPFKISMEAVENEIKEHLKLAKELLDNFSDSIKSCSWFVKAKISIEEFVQKKTREFLKLARTLFDNLSNIIKKGFGFPKVKINFNIDEFVHKNMTNEYLNLARCFFESFSHSFKQKFDEVKVCIEEFVQKISGSGTFLALVEFFPYFMELLKKLNKGSEESYDLKDMKEVIILLCDFLLYMGYGGIMHGLVIEAIKYCVKNNKGSEREEFDVDNKQGAVLGYFLSYMLLRGIGKYWGRMLRFVIKAAIEYYLKKPATV